MCQKEDMKGCYKNTEKGLSCLFRSYWKELLDNSFFSLPLSSSFHYKQQEKTQSHALLKNLFSSIAYSTP